jgi:hypothetical protein
VAKVGTSKAGGTISQQAAVRPKQTNKQIVFLLYAEGQSNLSILVDSHKVRLC